MPIYEYECPTCGCRFSEMRPVEDFDKPGPFCLVGDGGATKRTFHKTRTVRVVSRLGAVIVQGGTK